MIKLARLLAVVALVSAAAAPPLACAGPIAVPAIVGCAAFNSPTAKTAEHVAIDVAAAVCVAEAGTLDVAALAQACNLTADVVNQLVGAKKVGMAKMGGVQCAPSSALRREFDLPRDAGADR